jgi:SAM-dependent methyltransferase
MFCRVLPVIRDERVGVVAGERGWWEALAIRTVLGDMRDLGVFPDASFNVVFNPVSNVFCPDLAPVWRESFRVLRPGGILLAGFMNPDVFIFDIAALERDELVMRYPLPFSSLDLPDAERLQHYGDSPVEYSHSLTEQIGGQMAAGFTPDPPSRGAASRGRHGTVPARFLRYPRHQAQLNTPPAACTLWASPRSVDTSP